MRASDRLESLRGNLEYKERLVGLGTVENWVTRIRNGQRSNVELAAIDLMLALRSSEAGTVKFVTKVV